MASSIEIPACLEDARLKSLPADMFYIANFISPEEEQMILGNIQSAPKPRWKVLTHRRLQTWPSDLTKNNTLLLDTSLPNWLLDPIVSRLVGCPVANDSQNHIFSNSPHGAPNHVLVNECKNECGLWTLPFSTLQITTANKWDLDRPGEGIMPHKDGSAYHPVVCTVSLGSTLTLEIYGTNDDGTRESEPKYRILQEPRSLLITTGELYTEFMHGIAETDEDTNLNQASIANWDLLRSPEAVTDGTSKRATRTSLTYRDVIKVSKLGAKFGFLGKR